MRLFEYEGKQLFESVEIPLSKRTLVESAQIPDYKEADFPLVAKAQVLSGKRGKRGLVKVFSSLKDLQKFMDSVLNKTFDTELVESILIEKAVDIDQELFASITYSTATRGPVLLFSEQGGVEIETQGQIREIPLSFGVDIPEIHLSEFALSHPDYSQKDLQQIEAKVWQTVQRLWELFQARDLFLAEINPLVITTDKQVIALDAKVVTDDAAGFRQQFALAERNMLGTEKSWAEIEAAKIDAQDHQGVVGRVYLDLPGDIGVIAAGGGASLVAMDALISFGLKPANYTEFSGNPPQWKVKRLTEIVLAKENLKGAILVGGKANFTDQVETLSGFLEALQEIDPKYPIIVRRDGPRMAEAKAMLEQEALKHGWKLVVMDAQIPIIQAVKELAELVK